MKIETRFKKILIITLAIVGLFAISYQFVYKRSFSNKVSQPELSYEQEQYALTYKYMNENNYEQALVHAKNLQNYDKENLNYDELVAIITEQIDPEAATAIYRQELQELLDREDVAGEGSPFLAYWTIAGIAEKADETDIAIEYYNKVISAVDKSNPGELFYAEKSQEAIEELRL